MKHFNSLKFLLSFILCYCCTIGLQAQQLDSLFEEEASIMEFLRAENLLPTIDMGQVPMLEGLYKSHKKIALREALRKKISGPKVQLSSDNYFFSGDTTYLQNLSSKFYNNIGLSSSVNVGNIPITLNGNAILVNGKLDTKLSSLGIQFNAQQYLENIKDKYSDLTRIEDLFDLNKNPLQLPETDINALKETVKYTLYQQILANPKYRAYKDQLYRQVDSLKQDMKDTLLQDTAIYHETMEKWEKIQEVETRYRTLWEEKSKMPYDKLKTIKSKIEGLREELEASSDPSKLKNKLLDETKGKALERLGLLTKHLNIGLFSLDEDDLTVRYLTLNGARYAYEDKQFFGEIAYGNQSLTTSFLPSLGALALDRYYGRRVFFAKAGVKAAKTDQNSMQFSFLKVDDRNNPEDSLFVFPKKNIVLGWSGQTSLAKQLSLKASAALSDTDFGNGVDLDDDFRLNEDKLAFTVESIYEAENGIWSLGLGYFYNGASFVSLANPYLLTNKQGVSLNTRLALFKDKLLLRLKSNFGTNIQEGAFVKFDEFQVLGELTYRLGNQSSISASFMPNVFLQSSGQQAVRANNTIYTIQGNFFNNLPESQLLTIVQLTNLRTDFEVVDSVQISAVSYLYLQEMWLLPGERALNLTGMLGTEKFKTINNLLFQLDYKFPIKKLSLNIGSQVLQQAFSSDWQYGFLGRISYPFSGSNAFGLNVIYRNKFKQKEAGNNAYFLGNVSLLLSI